MGAGSDPTAAPLSAPVVDSGTEGAGTVPPGAPAGAPDREIGPPVYRQKQWLVLGLVLLAIALAPLRWDSDLDLRLFNQWMILAALGVSFYLVFGVGGVFAFSHTAFFAVGAYVSVWAARDNPFVVGFVAAIVVSALVAAVFMVLVARASHFYFAIATLALSFIALEVMTNWESFTAPGGEVVSGIEPATLLGFRFDSPFRDFWLMLGVLGIVLLLVLLIERSPLQREAIANRDNPLAAATLGVPTVKLNFLLFIVGSTMAGALGSVYAHRVRALTPDAFSVELALDLFVIVLLGGIGSMWGALLGAAYIVWFPELTESLNEYQGIIDGIIVVAVIIFFPTGLIGIWHRIRAAVARRRRGAPWPAPASGARDLLRRLGGGDADGA